MRGGLHAVPGRRRGRGRAHRMRRRAGCGVAALDVGGGCRDSDGANGANGANGTAGADTGRGGSVALAHRERRAAAGGGAIFATAATGPSNGRHATDEGNRRRQPTKARDACRAPSPRERRGDDGFESPARRMRRGRRRNGASRPLR
ncbi:DNA-binding protein [Burkholderia pseudomallei]|uniref:DNA-binding protein n=1 Tax=Burkholderia pseudomallei TaxID=28450 RepID=UPI002181E342|nr:DNA-binding protein [Burkholderia pseudomallei]